MSGGRSRLRQLLSLFAKRTFSFGDGATLILGALVKAFLLTSVAVFGLFGASALASDLPTKAPVNKTPIAAPPYNWSGFYVGANFGGAWTNGSLNIPGNNFYGGITEFIGGVQAGYNFQAGHLLLGVEGDFDWASFNHPALPAPTLGSVSHRWMSTVAGRVGLVNDRWLVFAKLGGGWVRQRRYGERPWLAELERVQHQRWLADWRRHRVRLQGALDRQTRIRLSRTVKLEFGHGPGGGIEPRRSNDQGRHQL